MWAFLLVHFAGIKAAGPVSHCVSGWVRRHVFQVLYQGMAQPGFQPAHPFCWLPAPSQGQAQSSSSSQSQPWPGARCAQMTPTPHLAAGLILTCCPSLHGWASACSPTWFPAPLTCFLLFPGFLVILPHTSDRKPTALSAWPCYNGLL